MCEAIGSTGLNDIPDYENYDYKAQWADRSIVDRAEKELIVGLLKGKRECLELGGGFGRITAALEPSFSEVVMTDYSNRSLRAAQGSLTKALITRCDIRMLPFRDDSFGSAIAVRVLHHIKNLQQLIGELVRVCRDGATVVFAVPNPLLGRYQGIGQNHKVLIGKWNHVAYAHSLEEYGHPQLTLVEVRGSGIFDNRIGRRLNGFPNLSKFDVLTSRVWLFKPVIFLKYRIDKGKNGGRRDNGPDSPPRPRMDYTRSQTARKWSPSRFQG